MVSPAGKAPSKTKVKRDISSAESIAKHGPALKKLHSGFSKLNKRQQSVVATSKALQGYFPDDPDYSDKSIRNKILSYLGVASGEFDDHKTVGRDSAGRRKLKSEQKKKNPAGFAYGGVAHPSRGRKANYNG